MISISGTEAGSSLIVYYSPGIKHGALPSLHINVAWADILGVFDDMWVCVGHQQRWIVLPKFVKLFMSRLLNSDKDRPLDINRKEKANLSCN